MTLPRHDSVAVASHLTGRESAHGLPRARPIVQIGISLPMVSSTVDTPTFISELIAEVRAAERNNIDLCLVPEHHGGPPGALSDALTVVGWLLARTESITIGPGVLILPLHSLPRLAEVACLLQNASQGRLLLGVGAGYQHADFEAFGVSLASRATAMDTGIASLKLVWDTGDLDGHPVRPTLTQSAAPPIYVGAWTKSGVRRAARMADGWIADPIRTTEETARAADEYLSLARAASRPATVVVMREGWIADTDDQARNQYGPVIEPIFRYYLRHGAFPASDNPTEADLRLSGALSQRVLVGSIDSVTDQVLDLVHRTHASAVVFGLRHPGGPNHHEVMAAIERLGEVRRRVNAVLAEQEVHRDRIGS